MKSPGVDVPSLAAMDDKDVVDKVDIADNGLVLMSADLGLLLLRDRVDSSVFVGAESLLFFEMEKTLLLGRDLDRERLPSFSLSLMDGRSSSRLREDIVASPLEEPLPIRSPFTRPALTSGFRLRMWSRRF